MSKSYKDFSKKYIGSSDIARLIISIPSAINGLYFGGDGIYYAYVCYGNDVEIGEHYKKVCEGATWLTIYDDDGISYEESRRDTNDSQTFTIYRAGDYDCIIHWHD